MNRNADGDFLTPGQPPVVTAVTFMCVLFAGAQFGLKTVQKRFCRMTSLE